MTTYHFIEYTAIADEMLRGRQAITAYYDTSATITVSVSKITADDVLGYLVVDIDSELLCFLTLAGQIAEIEHDEITTDALAALRRITV